MDLGELFAFGCIFVFTAIGLVSDFKTRKLPNWLTVPAFGVGLLYQGIHGYALSGLSGALHGLGYGLTGFAVAFCIMLILWLVGGVAGGDVKFFGALGCWLGTWLVVQVFILSGFLAALASGVTAIKRTFQMKRVSPNRSETRERRRKKKEKQEGAAKTSSQKGWQMAFGVYIAIATWLIMGLELAGLGLKW